MVRVTVDQDLAIKDVAEQTGIAAGTIRMWEQRYGFPEPERTASGYRRYRPGDVEALRRVQAYRHRGLSVPAAIERAPRDGRRDATGRRSTPPSCPRAATPRPQVLRKSTLVALSRAIEHETLAHAAAPVLFAAFQREPFYREVEPRYARIAQLRGRRVRLRRLRRGAPARTAAPSRCRSRRPTRSATSGPSSSTRPATPPACWPGSSPGSREPGDPDDLDRRFEAIWTLDPVATRRAARVVAARLAARADPEYGGGCGRCSTDRPLALEEPAPALTALTNRVVAYLERR